jgi:cyanate lyase
MTRNDCTSIILDAISSKNIRYEEIAQKVGRHIVWTTLALHGQASMDAEEAAKATAALGLGKDIEKALQSYPERGSLMQMPPTDPTYYRFYELVMVYGTTLKALINEKFGDGIMSAIDFNMDIDRIENPNGDRVRITMEGKFLPYKKW